MAAKQRLLTILTKIPVALPVALVFPPLSVLLFPLLALRCVGT